MAEQQFNWRLEKWFPNLSKETSEKLAIFYKELLAVNGKLSLVSAKSLPHADLVHFADSLLAFDQVYKIINKSEYLYDICSGSGFPGLVIAIAYPDVQVCLVEPDVRRVEFLRRVISVVGIKNATVLNQQPDSIEESTIEQGISRGYTTIPKAFLTLRKPLKANGTVYFMKGSDWPIEVSQVPTQLCSFWTPKLFHEYKLPTTDSSFYVIAAKRNP